MKLILGFLLLTLVACGQKAQTFNTVATFNSGFRFSPTGTIYTSMPVSTTADWNTLLNKPTVFPTTWALVAGKPLVFNPDLSVTNPLYKPIAWKPDYNTDILNKPGEVELVTALAELGVYLGKTTTELNAITPANEFGIAFDKTEKVYKFYSEGAWRVNILGN